MSELEVRDAWLTYPGGVEALKGARLKVRSGEIVTVLGGSGSGKSTLLLVAAGLLKPYKGEVLLDGKPLDEQLPSARRKLGVVFQEPDDQLFNPTVFQEISYALRQLGLNDSRIQEDVKKVAVELGLDHLLHRSTFYISGGEKRRVALASVLVYQPEILIIDEPTAYLDPRWRVSLENLLKKLKGEGRGVVTATHDVDFVARISDRVYLMKEGRTLAEGDPETVLTNVELLQSADVEPPSSVKVFKLLGGEGKPPLKLEDLPVRLRDPPV